MTVWISRRPDAEIAAEIESRGGDGHLAGLRLAVDETSDAAAVEALRTAGAVVVGTTHSAPVAVATGAADLAVAAAAGSRVPAAVHGIVAIAPTAGVIIGQACRTVVFAPTLASADRATAVLAAAAPERSWPSDVRLAAAPAPVVAIPEELPELDGPGRAAFERAVDTLAAAGARIVRVGTSAFLAAHDLRDDALAVLDGADALLVPAAYTTAAGPFGLCAVTVPTATAGDARGSVTVVARAFDDAVALDVAALLAGESPPAVWPLAGTEHVELVVFGAHLAGGPLAHQLTDRGARFAGEITTAPRYRMTVLPTNPPKPGVTRVADGTAGSALSGHRWLMSPAALGAFLAALPAPMQLGKVEFADGSWRTGFGCDGSARGADISGYGSWTNALAAGAVEQT